MSGIRIYRIETQSSVRFGADEQVRVSEPITRRFVVVEYRGTGNIPAFLRIAALYPAGKAWFAGHFTVPGKISDTRVQDDRQSGQFDPLNEDIRYNIFYPSQVCLIGNIFMSNSMLDHGLSMDKSYFGSIYCRGGIYPWKEQTPLSEPIRAAYR